MEPNDDPGSCKPGSLLFRAVSGPQCNPTRSPPSCGWVEPALLGLATPYHSASGAFQNLHRRRASTLCCKRTRAVCWLACGLRALGLARWSVPCAMQRQPPSEFCSLDCANDNRLLVSGWQRGFRMITRSEALRSSQEQASPKDDGRPVTSDQ
eukprot:scaffold733_cov267-Pinguiococcus_pyrenoidosus.AAC.38